MDIKQIKDWYDKMYLIYHNYRDSVVYRLDHIWYIGNKISDTTQHWLNTCKTPTEFIDKAMSTHMYAVMSPPDDDTEVINYNIDWQLNNQQKEGIGTNFEESKFVPDNVCVYRNDKRLSVNFLRCVFECGHIAKHISEISSVFEIGAGMGHLARLLKLTFNIKQYTIVDIPETLCFCYIFICKNFPEAKCLLMNDHDQDTDGYDFVFMPTVFLHKLQKKQFDLFVNTASMGEMNNEVIRHYMTFIQKRCLVKNLYTLNRFLNDDYNAYRINENEASVHYDDKWTIKQWELEPLFIRCPYVDSTHSRYVEIIASREEFPDKKIYAQKLLHEVKKQDWFRCPTLPRGQNCMRLLNPDLSMSGTLFKLWESIRLDPTPDNVQTMRMYLKLLNEKNNFDENPYYDRLLHHVKTINL
jgi:putative sugar O-methyltransferase